MLVLCSLCHGGLFSWLFKSKTKKEEPVVSVTSEETTQEDTVVVTDVAINTKIPFEIKSSDETFLKEAVAYTSLELSELDVCHHKVILGLQTSCAELSEEELSKVAVNLLNCQSVAESRQIYPCTRDMTLADCTRDMSPSTWNAYHIVSNRARAVCYASRQEQFGAKTQMAVNLLMYTAEEQIKSMSALQETQEALGKSTSETLESLNDGHEHLKQQQKQLSTAHHAIHTFVSSNLRELSREKKLIASGQRELAYITESIKRKLDEAKQQLLTQENSQRETHSIILQDLSKIQDNALKVWQKLDASTQKILSAHEDTVQQYGKLTDDLQRMNETVHHLMDVLQSTKQGVEDKLSWISSFLGGTDNTVQKVYSCVLHAGYFFIGMVSASFLQVPYFTRLALVVLVPLNALAEVKHDTSLDFSTLTTIMALCIFVNLSISFIWGIYQWQKKQKNIVSGGVPQPVIHQPSAATPAASFSNFSSFEDQERTPLGTQQIMKSLDVSPVLLNMSDVAPVVRTYPTDDYSSDEELHTVPPLRNSFVRRRIIGDRTGGFGSPQSSDDRDEEEETRVTNLEDSTTNNKNYGDLTDMVMPSVRNPLLDQLNNSVQLHHNLSLDSRVLENSSPLIGTPTSRSGTPSRSMTARKLCTALCKNGQLCRNFASGESLSCYQHSKGSRKNTPHLRRESRESTPVLRRGSRESTPVLRRGLRESTPLLNRL